MSASQIHVKMEQPVRMASIATPVSVLVDMMEKIVKQVRYYSMCVTFR